MADGCVEAVGVSNERAEQYQGGVTLYVVVACMVAAIGGSIFGYDIGISGMYARCFQIVFTIIFYFMYRTL
jgi:hypothetical protein